MIGRKNFYQVMEISHHFVFVHNYDTSWEPGNLKSANVLDWLSFAQQS